MFDNEKKGEAFDCKCATEKHIHGIVCDVKNCRYHDCDTHCTADQIMVGPSHAEHSGETACVTFKPKAE